MSTRTERAGARTEQVYRPLWFTVLAGLITLGGLGISIYLTLAHYNDDVPLKCSTGSKLDCHSVTTSKYSELLGIPLPLLGLSFFVGFAVLVGLRAAGVERPLLRWGRLASVGLGLVFVFYLIAVELVALEKICVWCTGVHAATVLLFALVIADEFLRVGRVD